MQEEAGCFPVPKRRQKNLSGSFRGPDWLSSLIITFDAGRRHRGLPQKSVIVAGGKSPGTQAAFLLQPLAPCGTALEGALLGSFKVFWVGGRTVASAAIALGVLKMAESLGWGLLGAFLPDCLLQITLHE